MHQTVYPKQNHEIQVAFDVEFVLSFVIFIVRSEIDDLPTQARWMTDFPEGP